MSLEDLLRACTVRVDGGPKPGAGFFVAPGVVITCAHVAGADVVALRIVVGDGEFGHVIRMRRLKERGRPIADLDEYPDLAVLELDVSEHRCVAIDEDLPTPTDRFQIYGYPAEGGSVNLTPAMLSYRGIQGEDAMPFIDLMSDTVKRGMSGAALLKLGSGRVCGLLVATRNATAADGGLAIPWAAVSHELADVLAANREFHVRDGRWRATTAQLRAARIRFGLPHVTRHFVGRRHELHELEEALALGGGAVVTQAITGLGGVGKSQIAAAYVREHADEYEIVAWIAAEDGGVADLAKLAGLLGVEGEGLTQADRAERAVGWLASTERRWLLVLDNITDLGQLSGCVPATGNGRILVTSRNRDLADFAHVVRIDVFSQETAIEYLLERAQQPTEHESAARLAEALGRLPLALAHAGAYCRTGTSFDDYRELLVALPADALFDRSPEAFYQMTIASTWQQSIQAAQDITALSRPVLELAAFVAPDEIPVALCDVLVSDVPAPLARKQIHDALDALGTFSLTDPGRSATTFSVHRLLQKVIREDAHSRADPQGAVAALDALRRAFPGDVEIPSNWPICEALSPHLIALAQHFPDAPSSSADLTSAMNQVTAFMLRSGGSGRGTPVATLTVSLARRLLGDEHPDTLTAYAELANSYRVVGRTGEAIELEERLVADRERLLGDEHPHTLTSRANLANSYRAAGRTSDAIELGERVVADRERLLGDEHRDTVAARGNLASAYHAAGRTNEAIELAERVLADRERLLGDEHPHTLTSRANLANSYRAAGRTSDAIELEEPVLAGRERLLGDEHPETLTARSNLASSYQAAGRINEAIELEERVLADSERQLGDEHPRTLAARANLAISYRAVGRTHEAIELAEWVLAANERLLGPEHPDTLSASDILASSYRAVGRTDEAIELGLRVVADRKRLLGDEHPDTLTARGNLAGFYWAAGRAGEAVELGEVVLASMTRLLGDEHPDTLTARGNLAGFYWAAGRAGEAVELGERALASMTVLLGDEHPDTLAARINLAAFYWAAGRGHEAIEQQQRAATLTKQLLGDAHPLSVLATETLHSWRDHTL